jgi:hypothetical protein
VGYIANFNFLIYFILFFLLFCSVLFSSLLLVLAFVSCLVWSLPCIVFVLALQVANIPWLLHHRENAVVPGYEPADEKNSRIPKNTGL